MYIDDVELTAILLEDKEIVYSDIYIADLNYQPTSYEINSTALTFKRIKKLGKNIHRVKIPIKLLSFDDLDNMNVNIIYKKDSIINNINTRIKYIASEKLGEKFIEIEKNILKKHNWRGYTSAYKDELQSSAYYFFARYWWKFNPARISTNWKDKQTKEMKDKSEWKGAFLYLTSLCYSANISGIKFLNKEKDIKKEIMNDNLKISAAIFNSLYNESLSDHIYI